MGKSSRTGPSLIAMLLCAIAVRHNLAAQGSLLPEACYRLDRLHHHAERPANLRSQETAFRLASRMGGYPVHPPFAEDVPAYERQYAWLRALHKRDPALAEWTLAEWITNSDEYGVSLSLNASMWYRRLGGAATPILVLLDSSGKGTPERDGQALESIDHLQQAWEGAAVAVRACDNAWMLIALQRDSTYHAATLGSIRWPVGPISTVAEAHRLLAGSAYASLADSLMLLTQVARR